MNYNDWFYKYHEYLTGTKGPKGYNDTKWETINDRYSKLVDTMSSLLDEQPYNVIGNYTGFQQLYDLMQKSNYTFEDIDQSLIETYRMTLQNAMGNMMVNTHCVIAKYRYDDKKHVSQDKYAHYYIIDVPFAQMHFGERDEFVRQKLHAFYETESRYFMPADRFLSNEISRILGFTIICCTNGYMSDDWYVGISEQGFRFKIGWRYSSDVEFMIMKLDESSVLEANVPTSIIRQDHTFTFSELGIDDMSLIGKNCIVQISDINFRKEVNIAPNFGYFTREGLLIPNIQTKTITDLQNYKSETTKFRIYVIKYLREVPGIFPAVNYYDMMSAKYVYNDKYDHIDNGDAKRIVLQDTKADDKLPICTPPISLTRVNEDDDRHAIITKCANVDMDLESVRLKIKVLGENRNNSNPPVTPGQPLSEWYQENVLDLSRNIYNTLYRAYTNYANGAMMTTLIPMDLIQYFRKEIERFYVLSNAQPNFRSIQETPSEFDLLYGDNFKIFVKKICTPLQQPPFSTFGKIKLPDYFPQSTNCVNRPVSEQCLIVLKYNTDEDGCWVFDYPKIEHFHGIDNTFYISSDLNGDELFKFMFLYTDTENPSEREMITMTDDELIDFDLFTKEVDKHMGYIRYWDVSNRLLKLSHMFYRIHDESTELSIITKVMKRKLDGDIFLDYASEVNYELSNVTSDNIQDYTEQSIRAPFTINFLFYTLSLFYRNKNRMQSYLLHMITDKEFYPRYSDLKLNELNHDLEKELINYSVISYSPQATLSTDRSISSMPDISDLSVFNGIQFPLNPSTFVAYEPSSQDVIRYPFTFNVYQSQSPFYMLTSDGLDTEYYLKYNNILSVMGTQPITTYYDDAQLASMISILVSELYDGISVLTTNYVSMWNTQTTIKSIKHTVEKRCDDIQNYLEQRGDNLQVYGQNASTVIEYCSVAHESNPVYFKMNELDTLLYYVKGTVVTHGQPDKTIFTTTDKLLTVIRKLHENTGFDRYAIRNVRRLYIQLKQLNQGMGLYQYAEWLENIDVETMEHLTDYLSNNPNRPYTDSYIIATVRDFLACRMIAQTRISQVQPFLDSLLTTLQTTYFDILIDYCDDVMNNCIFDYYVMNKISFTQTLNAKPAYAEIQLSSNLPHVAFPIRQFTDKTFAILAQVKYDNSGSTYYVTDLIPTCENAFCAGDDINVSVVIFDVNGNEIQTFTDIPVTFTKVGLSSDIRNNIERFLNTQNIPIDVQNVHESFDVNGDGNIIQTRHAELHYELLCGNHFSPITHTSEYCSPYRYELQGPIDKLYLSCEQMNKLSMYDESNRPTRTMFFRPCQVFHIEPVEDTMTSIGGKYFEGQTLYAITDDLLCIFPIIITKIDHSIERGFIEAKVDMQHTKWTETNDIDVIHKYLTTNIDCNIADDNIRNFLDEFSDYTIDVSDPIPGDPPSVQSKSDDIYEKLAEMFGEDGVPNRFHVDDNLHHHFVYIGSADIMTDDAFIELNMINHNFNTYTLPELYTVLRTEPDDHQIWDKEKEVFQQQSILAMTKVREYDARIYALYEQMAEATTEEEKRSIRIQIEECELKKNYWYAHRLRMDEYEAQLESPTTWYNVRAYDDALVYINNGRAHLSRTFHPYVMDLLYSDKMQVLLYDWEHKEWIDPSAYYIETTVENGIHLNDCNDSDTDNVMTSMTIIFNDTYFRSKRLLIYFVYESSDVYSEIELHDMNCVARFQPVISVYADDPNKQNDQYESIRIRKHYDESEIYRSSKLKPLPESFGPVNGFTFDRPSRSGYYTTGSPIRFGDLRFYTENNTYTYQDFDVYIKKPVIDTSIDQKIIDVSYNVSVMHAAENMEAGHVITLISVNDDEFSSFDKTASSVMFTAITTDEGIQIQQSTIQTNDTHDYVCTIIPDESHPIIGGVYIVSVSSTTTTDANNGDWIKLHDISEQGISLLAYRLIPNEVALLPHSGVDLSQFLYLELGNLYQLDTFHDVSEDNTNEDDLYVYYYDKENDIKYPIGNVLTNTSNKRLTIDLTTNTNVDTIRSNHIGICRYATQKIPSDGVVDLTGLIPTPLSRDRYEFWVNGRYVSDPSQIIILSPTSFQLRNMTSLKNLDVVELVDDISINAINRIGNAYVDFDGNIYTSYLDVLKHRADIVDQSIGFIFNQSQKTPLDTYLYDDIRVANNHDYETDIMSYIQSPEITSYNQLHNIPTINSVSLFNLTSTNLGLQEIKNEQLLKAYDKTWKLEGLNGITPFKHLSAYIDTIGKNQILHVQKVEDGYEIYTTGLSDECFTLYISTSKTGKIDEITKTKQIIPMIRPGTRIIVSDTFDGMWIHSTLPNVEPIQIK